MFLTLNTVFAQKQAHYETAYLSDSANVRLVMTNIGESLFSPAKNIIRKTPSKV